jgi:hypothetical protein
MRGEWGKEKTPFPLIKRVVRVKRGYTQSFGGPLALFLIFHEFMSKGGHPSSQEMVILGCWLSNEVFSKWKITFPT